MVARHDGARWFSALLTACLEFGSVSTCQVGTVGVGRCETRFC
jgi:hypothetical protein